MRPVPPSLSTLAHHAGDLERPLARLSGSAFPLSSLAHGRHWRWMHGVRCGPAATEVAVPFVRCFVCGVLRVIAADRDGEVVVFDACLQRPRRPDALEELVVDAALRLLGLPTPPPVDSPATLSDTVWLDQVFDLCLLSPVGEPPPWTMLSALHPCARGVPTPEAIRHERQRSLGSWTDLRTAVLEGGAGWVPAPAALAEWFDEGSFARWIRGAVPDPETMVEELAELLRPPDFRRVLSTLDLGQSA